MFAARFIRTRKWVGRPSGDLSAVEPPVPIPNTEVKRCSPDDSASIGCAKVGRRQYPRPDRSKHRSGLFFSVCSHGKGSDAKQAAPSAPWSDYHELGRLFGWTQAEDLAALGLA